MEPRENYQTALSLRLEGKTYGEIRSVLKVPKSTLSTWFSKLRLNNRIKKILESKRSKGYYKLIEFNKTRTVNIKKENENIRKNYESRIKKLSGREMMILGAALYWGEGYKNFGHKKNIYPYICFGNSDPLMIRAFMVFLNKALRIDSERIKCQAMIYPGINSFKAIEYWQKITNVPIKNFRTQLTISRSSQGKRPWNVLPFGTLQLRVTRRQDFFKIRGLIDGIVKTFE